MIGSTGCSTPQPPDEPVGEPPEEQKGSPIWLKDPEDRKRSGDTDPESEEPSNEKEGDRPSVSEPSFRLRDLFPDRTLDLDFRNASVRRIVRVFRADSRLHIALAPKVRKRITVSTEDADMAEAFKTVLQIADLQVRRRANTLFVEPRSG